MNLSKLFWLIVIGALVMGGWFLTTSGMEKVYNEATDTLPGNDPAQDAIDEAALTKYGEFQMTIFRYANAKMFFEAATNRYGESGKNYWSNYYQLGQCEKKLKNELVALNIYYDLWEADAGAIDVRVPSSDVLKSRIQQLIALNDLNPDDYPMD